MTVVQPTVSIVTVVFNGEKYLEQTIQSVIGQTYSNVEYIIIDGQSQDSTLEIIKKYENQIDFWSSEPDEGIYDAMNKGLEKATGDIIAFLNADDWYELDTIESIVDVFSTSENLSFVFGDVQGLSIEDGTVINYKVNLSQAKRLVPFGQPALFVKTQVHKNIPFDLSFKIGSDYDFILTLLEKNLNFEHLNKVTTHFRSGGISGSSNMLIEDYRVLKKHFGMFSAIKGLSTNFILNNFWKLAGKFFSDKKIADIKTFMKKILNVKS